jgi:polyhydroxyalkanoate synthase
MVGGLEAVAAAAPLDTLLAAAGAGPLRRWLPGLAGARFAGALARDPVGLARKITHTAGDLLSAALGSSGITPTGKDKRFADPAWSGNPALRRVMQSYLVASAFLEQLTSEAQLDWETSQRLEFLAQNLVEALAPTNNLFLNPAAWKATIDSGGSNLVRGTTALVRDTIHAPRIPQMVEPGALRPGRDLAVTPGDVIFRDPVFELIQYTPQTQLVCTVPLLIIPPTINKFYMVDLSPGRSLVEHLVRAGIQVFTISWRNPDRDNAHWGMDTYEQAIQDALDAVERATQSPRSLVLGLCSGGILTSLLMGHLAATRSQERIAGLSLLVTVLDQSHAGTVRALSGRDTTRVAIARSARKGYLDGATLAEVFAWLRPRDLVWSYWVNNYLLGKQPATFDILAWNADTTRMTARLHREFIELAAENNLVTPGAATALGSPVDLSAVHVDSYVVAGVADHLCPWQNCYATTQLLGGKSRFVLSTSGHIAAIVNPPGNPKAAYQVSENNPVDAERWREGADQRGGSWWGDYVDWLTSRAGAQRDATETMPTNSLGASPGTYVFGR